MIRTLTKEELIKFSKLRIEQPWKLFWQWIFHYENVVEDFEYIFSANDVNWKIIGIKIFFTIPIYSIVAIWKVFDFCLTPFDLEEYAEICFELMCWIAIFSTFGILRAPYAIYTYMRFNRATALINMLKSE